MSPSRLFILRPVATSLLMAAIMLVGMVAYRFLPLSALPEADYPTIQVTTVYSGARPASISHGHRPCAGIQADLRPLAAYGVNIDDLRTTINNANVNTPKGNFDGPTRQYTINANDQLRKASDYEDLVIAYRNGAAVRLADVAKAVEGAENTKLAGWMNTTE